MITKNKNRRCLLIEIFLNSWSLALQIFKNYIKSVGLENISVGDYQPIYDSEKVCKYVTKHIGKDVDYDIVFKAKSSKVLIFQTLEHGF